MEKEKHYKEEEFYPIKKIQEEMEKITTELKNNFSSGKFIQVNDFKKDVKNKESLSKLIKEINIKFPDKIGKQKKKNDYSGLYLFATKKGNIFSYEYVGISQQVITRLKQHVCNTDKGSATWAFLMAKVKKNQRDKINISKITKNYFKSPNEIKKAIEEQQELICKDYFVTYYPVGNHFLLHMVEPYVACALECKWNSFETH